MKLAKYKRYLRLAHANEGDIRYLPFVVIEREMSIEEARRPFAYSDWLIGKAEEISGAAAFRREYLGEWEPKKIVASGEVLRPESYLESMHKLGLLLAEGRYAAATGTAPRSIGERNITAAQPSRSTDPTAPAAHTLPAEPPEKA